MLWNSREILHAENSVLNFKSCIVNSNYLVLCIYCDSLHLRQIDHNCIIRNSKVTVTSSPHTHVKLLKVKEIGSVLQKQELNLRGRLQTFSITMSFTEKHWNLQVLFWILTDRQLTTYWHKWVEQLRNEWCIDDTSWRETASTVLFHQWCQYQRVHKSS